MDDWNGRRPAALRIGSVEANVGMRSVIAWFLARRDEPPPPMVLIDPRFAEVTLRLRREPDGLFNWASANRKVRDARKASLTTRRRISVNQELSDHSDATSSDSEPGPARATCYRSTRRRRRRATRLFLRETPTARAGGGGATWRASRSGAARR